MMKRNGLSVLAVGAVLAGFSTRALAQADPWVSFVDEVSGAVCSIVNSANEEFVVLAGSGELVIVTGPDVVLENTFVDDNGNVFLSGFPVGFLDYALDQFGFPKLFWFDPDGFMVGIDPVTGDLLSTTTTPDEIDGECAACEQWDDPADCGGLVVDTDLDGVDDEFDFCDNTPLDEITDVDGCSCSQNDGDDDGVSDCEDECPFTPLDELADEFGCSCSAYDGDDDGVDDCVDDCPNTPLGDGVDLDGCSEGDIIVVEPPPVIIACGNFSALTMMGLFAGLCSMGMGRRGRRLA